MNWNTNCMAMVGQAWTSPTLTGLHWACLLACLEWLLNWVYSMKVECSWPCMFTSAQPKARKKGYCQSGVSGWKRPGAKTTHIEACMATDFLLSVCYTDDEVYVVAVMVLWVIAHTHKSHATLTDLSGPFAAQCLSLVCPCKPRKSGHAPCWKHSFILLGTGPKARVVFTRR